MTDGIATTRCLMKFGWSDSGQQLHCLDTFRGTGDRGDGGGEVLYGLYPADNDCTFLKRSETILKRFNRHLLNLRVKLEAGGTFEIRITPRTHFFLVDYL